MSLGGAAFLLTNAFDWQRSANESDARPLLRLSEIDPA
jgi:hypothetical protein